MPRGQRKRKRSRKSAGSKAAKTRKRRERATKVAQRVRAYHAAPSEVPVYDTNYPWDRPEGGWEPPGGWQGDETAEDISYMTHEERIEWYEWLAEELDTTIHELFEMDGSP